jgi:hypothetical protein
MQPLLPDETAAERELLSAFLTDLGLLRLAGPLRRDDFRDRINGRIFQFLANVSNEHAGSPSAAEFSALTAVLGGADANAMPGWTVSTYLASLVATLSDKCELITRAGQLVLEIGLAAQQRRDEAEILLQAQEALFKELAALRPAEYCKRRRASAEELGISVSALDEEINLRRKPIRAETEEKPDLPLFPHWQVEPWPEPVDGPSLIFALVRRIRSHVVMRHDAALACALWTVMAWAHEEAAVYSSILMITSAEANSGKSTLLGVLGFLTPCSLLSVNISSAALYRSIEKWHPTLITDEADSVFQNNEDLRAVYNSGWTRGQGVLRCVGDDNEPRRFSTFCPKVLGLKGRKLPDTTFSRAIVIELKRKLTTEQVEEFKHVDDEGLADLRRQALRWVIDNVVALRQAKPVLPHGFANRLAANWRLLLAIAETAGGEWPDAARKAAENLSGALVTGSIGVELLAAIKVVFDQTAAECMSSLILVGRLTADPECRWSDWRDGKPLTQKQLAGLLKEYGIVSGTVHPEGAPDAKGYKRGQFEDACARYLAPPPRKSDSETSHRPNADGTGVSGESRSVRKDPSDGSDNGDLSNNHADLDAWTDRKAGPRREGHPYWEIEASILPGKKVAI